MTAVSFFELQRLYKQAMATKQALIEAERQERRELRECMRNVVKTNSSRKLSYCYPSR